MKKIYSILFALTVIISCSDAIDIEQPGILISDNAIQSVSDYNLALLGIYNILDNKNEIQFNAVFTDELSIGIENGGQNLSLYSLTLTPTTGISNNLWSRYYIAINLVNKLLEAGKKLIISPDQQVDYNNIRGQFLAIRAYAHFQLQTYFSEDLTKDDATGVIILDFIPQSTRIDIPRKTNAEVFEFINQDLDEASKLITAQSNRIFISQDFITAFRARMAAYRNNYSLANQLTTSLLSKYPIPSSKQFFDMFEDTDDTGIIFELERNFGDSYDSQSGRVGNLFAFQGSDINGAPYMELSRSLYNIIDDEDIRKSRLIHPTSKIDSLYSTNPNFKEDDILLIRKYPGHENQPLMNDIKIFRISEMLLLKAEAQIALGNLTSAAILLKQLQDNRYSSEQPLPIFTSENEAYQALLSERRKELALEGFRWVDLKRLGQKGGISIDRDAVDCNQFDACSLSNSDYRFTLPIPLREFDFNSLLIQNPGY
ncbi:MAG: RagB/SusD family nutrient uptake outer membrane protein [Tenacibaculum sp.]